MPNITSIIPDAAVGAASACAAASQQAAPAKPNKCTSILEHQLGDSASWSKAVKRPPGMELLPPFCFARRGSRLSPNYEKVPSRSAETTDHFFGSSRTNAESMSQNNQDTPREEGVFNVAFEGDAVDCKAGQSSDTKGSAKCTLCGAGKYSNVKGEDCKDCLKGQYRDGDDTAATSCTACGKGFYQNTKGQASCLPCLPGEFGNATGMQSCHKCDIGKVSEEPNATTCLDCKAGQSSDTTGSAKCTMCGAGKYSNVKGEDCKDCLKGRYRVGDDPDATSCKACGKGFYQNTEGQASCLPCLPGEFGNATGMLSCHKCDIGKVSEEPNAPNCINCESGQISSKTFSNCEPCGLGKYESDGICQSCKPGKYQDGKGETSCKNCPVDHYNSEWDATSNAQCEACHADRTTGSVSGATSDAECMCRKESHYRKDDGNCTDCPKGANCSKSNGITLNQIHPQPGYWRQKLSEDTFIDCSKTRLASNTGVAATERCCPQYKCHNLTSNATNFHSDMQCLTGYRGPLCAACATDHVQILNECVPCKGGASFGAAFSALALSSSMMCLFVSLALLKCATRRAAKSMSGKNLIGQVKILILFVQLLSSMPNAFDGVPWPNQFKLFATHISLPFTLDFLSAFALGGCHLSLFPLDAFVLHMLFVPMLAASVVTAYVVTAKLPGCQRTKTKVDARREMAIKIFLFLLQLMYPGLTARVFSIFRCHSFEGAVAQPVFVYNLLVKCHMDRHAVFEGLAVVFMLLYVAGVPLAVFLVLWLNRRHLNDESSPKHEAVKYKFGALYRQFTPQHWYFEIIIILNKMIMTGAMSIVEPGSPMQLILASLVMLAFTLTTLKLAPYQNIAEDWTSFLVSLVITGNTLAGFVLIMDKDNKPHVFDPDNIERILLVMNVTVLVIQLLVMLVTKWVIWEKVLGTPCCKKMCRGRFSSLHLKKMTASDGKPSPSRAILTKITPLHNEPADDADDTIKRLMTSFSNSEDGLKREASRRKTEHSAHVLERIAARRKIRQTKALSKSKVFHDVDEAATSVVLAAMEYKRYEKGSVLCRQGDAAECFYIIVSGRCSVTQRGESSSELTPVGVLQALDVMGESALLAEPGGRKRTATVTVTSDVVQTLELKKSKFDVLMGAGIIGHSVLERIQVVQKGRSEANKALQQLQASQGRK